MWFFFLAAAASLLRLASDTAELVLGVAAPVAAVMLFLSPACAARRALIERDNRGLPAPVFGFQVVACAISTVYGARIGSLPILITNGAGERGLQLQEYS